MDGRMLYVTTQCATIRQPKSVEWRPHADITAHEIALALPVIATWATGHLLYVEDAVARLPENVQRHFDIQDRP